MNAAYVDVEFPSSRRVLQWNAVRLDCLSLIAPRPYRPVDVWSGGVDSLQTINLQTINPNSPIADEEFEAILPELRVLSALRRSPLLRQLLEYNVSTPSQGIMLDDLRNMAEMMGNEYNDSLVVLGAALRIGLFEVNGGEIWVTEFGIGFASAWDFGTPARIFQRSWNPALAVELRTSVRWGWRVLKNEPKCRAIFNQLANRPTGLSHHELIESGSSEERELALRAVGAGCAIGAAWFTGRRWEPTMFGAYLAFHPQSALNSRSARG